MSHAPDPGDTWDCIAATLWPPEHFLMRGTSLHCIAACRAVGWQVEETASGSTWIIVEPRPALGDAELVGRIGPAPLMLSLYAKAFRRDDVLYATGKIAP